MENGINTKKLTDIIELAGERKASDIHLAVGASLLLRIDGVLSPVEEEVITAEDMEQWIELLLDDKQREQLSEAGELCISCQLPVGCYLRANIIRQRGGHAMTLHVLSQEIPTMESLGIPKKVSTLMGHRKGLLLLAGEKGSGKTTTMTSLVASYAKEQVKSVITLEKPIEYVYPQGASMILQREIGQDTADWSKGIQSAMAQDADVICVGELSDAAAIQMALSAAKMGHLVLASVSADSAVDALESLVGACPEEQRAQIQNALADTLVGVVAQQLLPKQNAGGRVAAYEVLLATQTAETLIRENKLYQLATLIQSSHKEGMQTMDDAIYDLYLKSEISSEIAISYAKAPLGMTQKVQLF